MHGITEDRNVGPKLTTKKLVRNLYTAEKVYTYWEI
jgi:hypothetical protein